MPLASGTRLGPYEITAKIGEGGMGEVYRATDTKLKREVAIKVLPAALASDAERLARFQREAEVLASLNHPNIAAIYGLEDSTDTKALVMELVEGPTLADRIAHGAVPTDEALPIAKQIAEALEAAHEQGIVHRDLKPANIKVRPDGAVRVLDFGLAKAMDSGQRVGNPGLVHASQLPTITTPAMTQAGVILGTAAYMSPEQARGKVVDKRTDIWAFGCVLYEMLAGRRAFDGEDVADTLGNVLKTEPDWTAMPPAVPAFVVATVRACLGKTPRDRVGDMQSVRLALAGAFDRGGGTHGEAASSPAASRRLPWAVAAVAALAALALALPAVRHLRETPGLSQRRVDLVPPVISEQRSFALSPDGDDIAWVTPVEGRMMLQVRSLVDGTTRSFALADGARDPFWAPDSRSIAFLARGGLKRLDLSDGAVLDLSVGAGEGQGGVWSSSGMVLFARNLVGPIFQMGPAGTASAVAVTRVERAQRGHVFPWSLPDGRHFVYVASGAAQVGGLFVGSVDGGLSRRLSDADAFRVVFVAGHLVFTRQGRLVAQPFDLPTLAFAGDPFPVDGQASGAVIADGAGFAVSASATGSLAFRPLAPVARQLIWFDRSGRELGRLTPQGDLADPSLSPDGRRLLVRRIEDGASDTWIVDLARGTWSPSSAGGTQPVWSPDGRRIGFYRARENRSVLMTRSVGGEPGSEAVVLDTPEIKSLHDWSPDGRFLIYQEASVAGDTGLDIWAVPVDGERTPVALVRTRFDDRMPSVSRDGRWLAFASNESGRYEVYVQPFPGPGERVRVSTMGGAQPEWREDGRELFFVGLDDRLMAVPIQVSAQGKSIEPGDATPLFPVRILNGAVQTGGAGNQYVVSPDGQRFLVVSLVDDSSQSPITLIENWRPPGTR